MFVFDGGRGGRVGGKRFDEFLEDSNAVVRFLGLGPKNVSGMNRLCVFLAAVFGGLFPATTLCAPFPFSTRRGAEGGEGGWGKRIAVLQLLRLPVGNVRTGAFETHARSS